MKDSDFASAVDAAAGSSLPLLTRLAFKHTFECFIDLSGFNQFLPVTSPCQPHGSSGGLEVADGVDGDPLVCVCVHGRR